MGIGMGFVMSPMSTAAMNAVDRAKAGVASGILSMNRMVGGTFGVAVLGAIVATLGRSKIDELLPATARRRPRASSPTASARAASPHGVPAQVIDAAQQRVRLRARRTGCMLGAGVALLGALRRAAALIRNAPTARPPSARPAERSERVPPAPASPSAGAARAADGAPERRA